jgi:competence ComEA-like helix-hairpin-helix protein
MNRSHLRDWFIFTKKDRRAVIVLVCLIGIVVVLPYFVPARKTEIHIDKELQAELDEYKTKQLQKNDRSNFISVRDTTAKDTSEKKVFYFDPNTLDVDGFTKLGLDQKVIHTIINYRNKGGYFKAPEDMRKIYGLLNADADRLIPYVRIVSSNNKQKEVLKSYQPTTQNQVHQFKKININTATAEDWKAFPGIGEVIANRIVKYRTSMGGFKSVEQVAKTYGLSDSVFQQIKPYLFLKDSTTGFKN